jgi:hypothetical protein
MLPHKAQVLLAAGPSQQGKWPHGRRDQHHVAPAAPASGGDENAPNVVVGIHLLLVCPPAAGMGPERFSGTNRLEQIPYEGILSGDFQHVCLQQ